MTAQPETAGLSFAILQYNTLKMASDDRMERDALIIQRLRDNAERAKHELQAADASARAEALVQWTLAELALTDALASAAHN